MAGEDNAAPAEAQNADDRKRFRSEIEFPYSDLEGAIEVAQTIHEKAGSSCDVDELAAWMGQTSTGGTFRSRLGAARLFGLIETGGGRATLTQLGRDALSGSGNERAARADAFLKVELFRAMYDRFKASALPPPAAIERQMEQLGVSPKQKIRARQTFAKSAEFAGFIDSTTGRFVKPGITQKSDSPSPPSREGGNGGGGDGQVSLNLDPLLIALLKKIPPAGAKWPEAQRVRWFRTFAMNVSQIYDDETPVELNIESESKP